MKIISSEQRLVKYLGNEISYTLLRKKVKNIIIKICDVIFYGFFILLGGSLIFVLIKELLLNEILGIKL